LEVEDEDCENFQNGYPSEIRSDRAERIKRSVLRWTDTAWQKEFVNLCELDISISVIKIHEIKEEGHCYFEPRFWTRLETLLNRTEMTWKVDCINIDLCPGGKTCDEDHTEILKGSKERSIRRQTDEEGKEQEVEEGGGEKSGSINEEEESNRSGSVESVAESGSSFRPGSETDSSGSD
jgi:hypothetical protein